MALELSKINLVRSVTWTMDHHQTWCIN